VFVSHLKKISALILALGVTTSSLAENDVSVTADKTADYAVKTYSEDMVSSLAELVSHNTVAVEGIPSDKNPIHIAFKQELKSQAESLGLSFKDDGYVVIISLGDSEQRVGVITHGDVQPANPSKWKQSPFKLDLTSEPGKLIGRGTEDDKGPISTALYAMKAIKDKKIKLSKRIELYVYMAEESDWEPLKEYVKNHEMPQTNITIDASYPVVTAEKGYGTLKFAFNRNKIISIDPYLTDFQGGYFGSQIPEDASVTIANADLNLLQTLMKKANSYKGVTFDFNLSANKLTIKALGKSAHSSKPSDGVNAITHLAHLLSNTRWANNGPGTLVNFINDNIGLDLQGKLFGSIAYEDEFMGPMTVSPTVIKQHDNNIELNINIRRPRGKSEQLLRDEINRAVANWKFANMADVLELDHYIGAPFVQTGAPHIPTLLAVFQKYTGIKDAKPVSIGGGTNSRLFPNAVSFGPSMPGKAYSGHSEHEFITMEQFKLNLRMYTAVLVELATEQ